mmetsp:Transcript_16663/g.56285  ORF Transcript_16663/g.56285 Transcript_16663/m.56285 type:complete len:247 (-) Transcript_16663:1370-2110(-)
MRSARGHPQFAIRAAVGAAQATLTLMLALAGVDVPHQAFLCLLQLASSAALLRQFASACDAMAVVRAASSLGQAALLLHRGLCGRTRLDETCDGAWHDVRLPLRLIHVAGAARMCVNGASLWIQFRDPTQGVTDDHGHEQLWHRSLVRLGGTPLHLGRGILKLAVLRHTRFRRGDLEITVNFLRALVLIPLSAWSLRDQWKTTAISLRAKAALSAARGKAGSPGSAKRPEGCLLQGPPAEVNDAKR